MKPTDQQLLEEAFYKVLMTESSGEWLEAPNDSGFWWFFGDPTYGAVKGKPPRKRLVIIEMNYSGNTLIGNYKGGFLYPKPYKDPEPGKEQREGYLGVWKKCEKPSLPESEFAQVYDRLSVKFGEPEKF
jgi:hypothetical protein